MNKTVKAWHFLPRSLKLTHGDNREVVAGEWLEVDGPPIPRLSGLHACVDILGALYLARGPVIQRVEMEGEIVQDWELIVATRRKCLWWVDVSQVLRRHLRLCALDVAHLWDAPDIVMRYLRTGDESLRVSAQAAVRAQDATNATWDSVRDAAQDATWDAARGPERASLTGRAGRAAAQAIALTGAPVLMRDSVLPRASARVAALASVREGACAMQRRRLLRLVHAEHRRWEADRCPSE